MITNSSGLEYVDLKKGTGAPATRSDIVVVHYTGWLMDGKKFDSSVGGEPFSFKLGVGEVIAGWDEGVTFMMVGGKRKLWIPAALGYGREGSLPEIPPNADLVFEVELLAIHAPPGASSK
jgi:FKBP-type peptidyl-prolyl cis-trans isomerase